MSYNSTGSSDYRVLTEAKSNHKICPTPLWFLTHSCRFDTGLYSCSDAVEAIPCRWKTILLLPKRSTSQCPRKVCIFHILTPSQVLSFRLILKTHSLASLSAPVTCNDLLSRKVLWKITGSSPSWNSIVLHSNPLHKFHPTGMIDNKRAQRHMRVVVGPTAGGRRFLPHLDCVHPRSVV
jgi:hypothetical protein